MQRPLPDHHHPALERLAQREEPDLELHLARLDLRQVEDVVDQGEQVVGRGEDVVQVLLLLLVHLAEQLLLQDLGEADDRVQRRPQLVAHVGQEVGLVLGGDLQRPGALGHAALQAGDQVLHPLGHLIEAGSQRSQLVLAIELDPLVEGACSNRLGRHLQALDRAD